MFFHILPSNRRVGTPRPEVRASRSVGKTTIHGAPPGKRKFNGEMPLEKKRWVDGRMLWCFFLVGTKRNDLIFLGEIFLKGVAGYRFL